jgi:hypothetical protein
MSIFTGAEIPNNGLIMMLDAANPKSFSPNTFSRPTDIYGWVNNPTGNNCTLSRDTTVTSPFGSTPMKMAVTGADPHTPSYNTATYNISTVLNGQTWTISVWAKASVPTTGAIFIFGANSSGVSYVNGAWLGIASVGFNITTEWQRFQCPITFNNADIAYIQTRLDGPDADGTGQIVWWDGLQVELASTASTFNPRTNTNRASWTDITGNGNSATLVAAPAYSSGVMQFNGSTQYAYNTLNLAAGTSTVIAGARYSGATRNRIIGAINNNYLLGYYSNGSNYYYASGWVLQNAPVASDLLWRIYTGTADVTADVYGIYNGPTLLASNNGGTAGPNGIQIGGGYNTTTELSTCEVSFVMAYNRVLSASEVNQVYQAYRGRFGIL